MSPALVTLVTSHPPPTFLRWTPCARSSGRRSYCACSNCSAATGTLFPHTKLISKTTFPPLSNSTDDRTMITDHSLTCWCGQFFHKVFPTKEIWMVTRTCRLDFRLAPCIVYSVTCTICEDNVFTLEHKTCDILAAERLRLMRFDNRLIIDSFQKAICILKW